MTVKESKRIASDVRARTKVLGASPRKSRDFLVRAGILERSGRQLSVNYRTVACTPSSPP